MNKSKNPDVNIHANNFRKAAWSEVTDAPALTALKQLQKTYADGFLVKMNNEFAWAFEDRSQLFFGASNAAGQIQLHALPDGQLPR